jgi:hypothetical protein
VVGFGINDETDQRLGYSWASSLIGFLGLAAAVIPFVFYVYGSRLRASSRAVQELAKESERQRRHHT